MTEGEPIMHRGQWEGQGFPNSFETFRLYGGGVEADVMLLNDGKTLAVAHPADLGLKDAMVESMSPEEFGDIKVKSGEQYGGVAPLFKEYLAGCYDRGVSAFFEIKGSAPEMAVKVARRVVETVKEMREEDAFMVDGKEHPEFLERMSIHSFSPDAIAEAKRALEETGLKLQLGFTWLSSAEYARSNPIAVKALQYYHEGDNWERAGLRAAHELGCDYIFFIEPSKITDELVREAHDADLQLYVYLRPEENTEERRDSLTKLGVDKLLY